MNAQPLIVEPGSGKTLQVLADRIRVLATGADTAGRYEVFELTGPEGSGPPSHCHPWDEAYFMLDGEIDVCIGEQRTRATAGAFVLAPGGVPHAFRIATPTARFVVLTAGMGAAEFFEAMDREIGFPPPSFDAVRQVAQRQGLRLA